MDGGDARDVDAATRDDLRVAYTATILDLWLPERLTVEPRPTGIRDGAFPAGIDHVHVITASNPRSRPLSAAENQARNDLLRRDLRRLSGAHEVSLATGRSADGGWIEHGFAVVDADRATLIDLAIRHGQLAIYAWTPAHLAVVWTAPEMADDTIGWSVTPGREG